MFDKILKASKTGNMKRNKSKSKRMQVPKRNTGIPRLLWTRRIFANPSSLGFDIMTSWHRADRNQGLRLNNGQEPA